MSKYNIIILFAFLSLWEEGREKLQYEEFQNLVKIGLVAQNIEQVFPELVSESNGIKSVNYQGLIPVLMNAVEIIKKQDKLEQVIAKMNEFSLRFCSRVF